MNALAQWKKMPGYVSASGEWCLDAPHKAGELSIRAFRDDQALAQVWTEDLAAGADEALNEACVVASASTSS
jgi:hypothetical protein